MSLFGGSIAPALLEPAPGAVIQLLDVASPHISPIAGDAGGNIPLAVRRAGDLLLVNRGGWFVFPTTVTGWVLLAGTPGDHQLWGRIATNTAADNFLNSAPTQQTITQMASFKWPYATVSLGNVSALWDGSSKAEFFYKALASDGSGTNTLIVAYLMGLRNTPSASYVISGPDGPEGSNIDGPTTVESNQMVGSPWLWYHDELNAAFTAGSFPHTPADSIGLRGQTVRITA